MQPPFEQWTWDDLVTSCTWEIVSGITEGRNLAGVVSKVLQLGQAWQLKTAPQIPPLALAPVGRSSSFKNQVIGLTTQALKEKAPLTTRALTMYLSAYGVDLPTRDPLGRIAAILSREKDRFTNNRRDGWSLKP